MSEDGKIKQETYIPHEGLTEGIEEWAQEVDLKGLPEEVQQIMTGVFRDGWSMCIHKTMIPARDLSMMLLQIIQISRNQGAEDAKVVLDGQALEMMEGLCHKIVGTPATWQLDDMVEAVHVDPENPPEDLPEEAREAMEKLKKERNKKKED